MSDAMTAPYEYGYCLDDGEVRCLNCEVIKGEPHTPECTGGSALVPIEQLERPN